MKNSIFNEVIPGVVFLLLGGVLWLMTPGQVLTTEDSAFTARTFPYLVLAIIMICSVILIGMGAVHTVRECRKETEQIEMQKAAANNSEFRGNYKLLVGIMLLILAAAAIGNIVSLLAGGLILTVGFLLLYLDKKWFHYVVVCTIVIVAYFMFKQLFGLNLP